MEQNYSNKLIFKGLWSRQVISALTIIVLCHRWWTRPSKVFKYWQLGKYFPPPCTRRPTRVQLSSHVQRWLANRWLKWDIVTSNICDWRSLDSNNSNVNRVTLEDCPRFFIITRMGRLAGTTTSTWKSFIFWHNNRYSEGRNSLS